MPLFECVVGKQNNPHSLADGGPPCGRTSDQTLRCHLQYLVPVLEIVLQPKFCTQVSQPGQRADVHFAINSLEGLVRGFGRSEVADRFMAHTIFCDATAGVASKRRFVAWRGANRNAWGVPEARRLIGSLPPGLDLSGRKTLPPRGAPWELPLEC